MTPHRVGAIVLDAALYLVLPLVGLFVWGWDWRPIVLLYWLENITIGGLVAIGLIRRRARGERGGMPWWFFLVHYGIFTFVHGVFVVVMIALVPVMTGTPAAPMPLSWILGLWFVASLVQWVLAIIAEPPPSTGVGRAYARVVVLHLTILGAVWIIAALGLPAVVAAFLVVLHAAVDLAATLLPGTLGRRGYRMRQTGPGEWALEHDPASDS
ncbi:MAG: DUF6498-containing protein [Protaetiibacter sp.]